MVNAILKLIIFDMDGLMIDTEQINLRAFLETCISWGIEPRSEVYARTIGMDDEREVIIFQEEFPRLDAALFHEDMQKLCAKLIREELPAVKPGLFELFEVIEGRGGIKKAVVTSNTEEIAVDLLTRAGIMSHLDGGVYREMVDRGKPYPDSHLLCCRMLGAEPSETLVLEDSEIGAMAAFNAGIPVISIPDIVEPSPEVLDRCLTRLNSLNDVIPFLDKYCG